MAEHSRDAQAAAFHDAGPDALVNDEQLAALHGYGGLLDTTDEPTTSIEAWETAGWDAERTAPKTVQEARQALAERVADPSASDTDATLYDGLEGA